MQGVGEGRSGGVGRGRAAQEGRRENRYDGIWIEPVEKPNLFISFSPLYPLFKFHNEHTLAHSPFLSPSLSPYY